MARELVKAVKISSSIVLYKHILHEIDLQQFIDSNENVLIDEQPDNESILLEDGKVSIYEWKKYKVRSVNEKQFTEQNFMGIGEYGTETYGILLFKNCSGKVLFKGIELNIVSKKMNQKECETMIEIVNQYLSNLSYDFNQSAFRKMERNRKERTDLVYHVYLLIINSLQTNDRQKNILANFDIIKNNPYRKMSVIQSKKNIGFVSDISDEAIAEIMSNGSELIECSKPNQLSKKLFNHGKYYIPKEIIQEEIMFDFDNSENRFIKFFLQYCLTIIEMFHEYFINKDNLINIEQIDICYEYKGILKNILTNSFLKFVGDMRVFPVSSTILTKRDGYRQLYQLFIGIKSIPIITEEDDAKEMIENKSLDVLYENFCYFMFANILCDIYGVEIKRQRFKVFTDEFSKTLEKRTHSNYFLFNKNSTFPMIKLHYNKNYTSGESYSKSYDPDISLEIYDDFDRIKKIYLFDSKFKVNVFNDNDDMDESTIVKMFKYDDISKMHAYKDAIRDALGAYIVYPGTEKKVFYEKEGNEFIGVGAFPLKPENNNDINEIKQMLIKVLTSK